MSFRVLLCGLLLVASAHRLPAPISEITPPPAHRPPEARPNSPASLLAGSWRGTARQETRYYKNTQAGTSAVSVTVNHGGTELVISNGSDRFTVAAQGHGNTLSFDDVRLRDTSTRGKQMTRHVGSLRLLDDKTSAEFTDTKSVSDMGDTTTSGTLHRVN